MMPLTLIEAKRLELCRICRCPAGPIIKGELADLSPNNLTRATEDGTIDPFVLSYGKEYAHASCLKKAKVLCH